MKKSRCLLHVVMIFLSVSVFSGAALAGSRTPRAPIIQNLQGDVTVKSGSSEKWESVKEPGFKLKNGSTVRTAQGSAEIVCPDGSSLKFEPNTTAIVSIAGDGRVQVNTVQGSVNATLGKSSIKTQIGQDQIVQEKYNPKTAETDISCVNGRSTLIMPNGAKIALSKGDVITSSTKDGSFKVQAGTAEVTQGTNTKLLEAGFEVLFLLQKPFYVRQFPWVRGRYGYMRDSFVTNEEYLYTDEYLSQQEAFSVEESATGQEGVATQEALEGATTGDASLQKEDLGDNEFNEGQSLQRDDGENPLEQNTQETEASSIVDNSSVDSGGVDNGGDDSGSADNAGVAGGEDNGVADNSGVDNAGVAGGDDNGITDSSSDDNSGVDNAEVDSGGGDNGVADSGGGDSGGDSGGGGE